MSLSPIIILENYNPICDNCQIWVKFDKGRIETGPGLLLDRINYFYLSKWGRIFILEFATLVSSIKKLALPIKMKMGR